MWLSFLYLTTSLLCSQAFPLFCHPVCSNCGSPIIQDSGFRPYLPGNILMSFAPHQPRAILLKIVRPMTTRPAAEQKKIVQTTTTTTEEIIQSTTDATTVERVEKIITTPNTPQPEENTVFGPKNEPTTEPSQIIDQEPVEKTSQTMFVVDSEENAIVAAEPSINLPIPIKSLGNSAAENKDDSIKSN